MFTAVDIALVTESRYENPVAPDWYAQQILQDDSLVQTALKNRGLTSVRVDWASPSFDWSSVRAAVLRTPWNYFERINEFRRWIDHVQLQTRLINSPELILWNLDKRYLLDLEKRGVSIPHTLVLPQGEPPRLSEKLGMLGCEEIVVKPVISGAARHTYRVNRSNLAEVERNLVALLGEEVFMVQPFLGAILDVGEISVVLFGGKPAFAVRKVAKAGDFRVQDDHGGKVLPHIPTREETDFAQSVVGCCSVLPSYARIDFVRQGAQLLLMELEIIEPELFLRFNAPSADLFAREIARALGAE